ncbi:hypothetical protein Glove_461g39 [Diversispora epigaea]|uniref:Attractin/MKLN-like beta-propeller domain-containing protein n=1 Tax=Diversispora epigaea TaxID=1348612 RepID=A0A397GPE9_9GLOM|nr:hypothetical protein Glove_461g39 [Diversispora epigaea]
MYLPFKFFKFIFCTLLLINLILCYDPPKRKFHNSIIIDNRLLIFNGDTNTTELFYLDLSKSFDNNNLAWSLIPEGSLPVYTERSTAVLSLDNSTIYLIGGYMRNNITFSYDYSNLVYSYDYRTSAWSTPKIDGGVVPPRQDMRGVIDNTGTIYIFGGFNEGSLFNDMNILQTDSKTWTTLSISKNLPIQCAGYTANILPNGNIVYIGGIEGVNVYTNVTLVNINQIKLFDTNKHEWSYMNATGEKIDSRQYFTSVLTPDGYIIIFGGTTYAATIAGLADVSPSLAMLDTNKNPFEWSIPSNSEVNSPPSIYGHSANLYNDYMIITFGFNLDTQLNSSQVYLYNIKSNNWVTTFSPPAISPPAKQTSKALAVGHILCNLIIKRKILNTLQMWLIVITIEHTGIFN